MTVVLVHGNPETDVIWSPLAEALGRDDVVRLSPPGFGSPLPEGFSATFREYRDWLVGELAAFSEPVDLVGHDWGGVHVVNAVMHRPALVRSWASDVVGLFDADYVWHDFAQMWQTPGAGEELIETLMSGSEEDRAERLASIGIPLRTASAIAPDMTSQMGEAILKVYRSARQPALADAGNALEEAAARPGLSVLATEDTFTGVEFTRRRAADRAGARTEVLAGLGHWWMLEDPVRGAAMLNQFWAEVDAVS